MYHVSYNSIFHVFLITNKKCIIIANESQNFQNLNKHLTLVATLFASLYSRNIINEICVLLVIHQPDEFHSMHP